MSLSELFLLEFNLKFASTRSFEKVQDILETALASLVPLTPSELFSSINALTSGNYTRKDLMGLWIPNNFHIGVLHSQHCVYEEL